MPNSTYYPPTNDGRAAWWQNIVDNAGTVLATAGLGTPQITSILADAAWGAYAYGTVRKAYDDFTKAVIQYADDILHGTPGGALPRPPVPPALPTPPATSVAADIESRREDWVQAVKHAPGYNSTIGATLGIETSKTPFKLADYTCELYGLSAPNAHTVGGKFRKAGGNVDSINFYGRKAGATAWTLLGHFTATPFSASVPVSGGSPEAWEFQGRAVRRDEEFGLPSPIIEQIVRP